MSITHQYRCTHEEAAKEAAYFASLPSPLQLVQLDDRERIQWCSTSRYHHLRVLGRKSDGYWHFSIQVDDGYAQQLNEALLSDRRIEWVPPNKSKR